MGKPTRHRHHRRLSRSHARVRLLGQDQNQGLGRLPRRGATARPGAVHRHHGSRRARRRVHRRRRRTRLQVRHLGHVAGGGDRRRPAAAEPRLRRAHSEVEGLHRGADAQAALRRRRHRCVRHRHGRLHVDAVGDVDHRLRDGLQRAVRHQPHAVGDHRRRDRHALLVDRRHVVDHADRHGPVRAQDHRHLLPAAAVHLEQGGRPRRHPGACRGHRVRPRRDRRADDHHVLRRLQLRHADRTGHLAAGVHRALAQGRQVGRHHRRDLLPALRHRGRAHRHGRVDVPSRRAGEGRRVRADRRDHPAGRHQRHRAGRRRRGDDVHRVGGADRHRHRGHAPT